MDGATSLPHWRVVDVRDGAARDTVAPFGHPTGDGASTTTARWDARAFRAALDLHDQLSEGAAPHLRAALHDLDAAYRLYGPRCIVGSYNGGKDACAIFHLHRAAHAQHCRAMPPAEVPRPRVVYWQNPDEFPEVLSLLEETVAAFDADMLAFAEGTSFGEGLTYLVERNLDPFGGDGAAVSHNGGGAPLPPPRPLAFVLGTRRGDPNAGSQGIYAPSSHYMPPFLRVNPVLEWTYGQVWDFLRAYDLPYCSLYDAGYTSLGTVRDTLPCPALRRSDGTYRPAYALTDWDQERAGRIPKKKKDKGQDGGDGDAGHDPGATMSQTSSTVSLAPDDDAATLAADANETAAAAPARPPRGGRPAVGLIVIGDELLKGMTPDINIFAAAKALRSHDVPLSRVSVISDDRPRIVNEIRRFAKEVDVIITSGGVGPTHDDITMTSVAEALGLDLEVNCEMAELLLEKMGPANGKKGESDGANADACAPDRRQVLTRQMSDGQEKMATLPTSAVLRYLPGESEEWPVMQCQNVFVLPGVPKYFENNVKRLAAYLPKASSELAHAEDAGSSADLSSSAERPATPAPRSDTYRIVLSLEEDDVVVALNAAVAEHPHVSFGSYPIIDDPTHKTIITLEGRFYNGGYTVGARRLAGKSSAGRLGDGHSKFFFTKEEMDKNVARALVDIKSRLPEEGIVCIDSCDDLRVR